MKAAVGGNHHGVVGVHFHVGQPEGRRKGGSLGIEIGGKGQELVVDAVIQHQQHVVRTQAVLDGEEPLARVVGLNGVDARRHDAVEGLPVGVKGDPAVHVELQVWPHLPEVILAGQVENALEEDLGPAWDTGDNADVLLDGGPGHPFDFLLPVRHQGNGPRRGAAELAPPGQVVDDDGAEVTGERAIVGLFGAACAADNQMPPTVEPGLRNGVHIHREQVLAPFVMAAFQRRLRDRDELAAVGGCAGGFGVPFHSAGPEHIGFSIPDAVDPRLQAIVVSEGHLLTVGFRRGGGPNAVLPSELGAGEGGDVVAQAFRLDLDGVPAKQLNLVEPFADEPTEDGVDGHGLFDGVNWGRCGERRCSWPRCRF